MKHLPHIVHIVGTMGMGGAQRQLINLIRSSEFAEFRHSIVCAIALEGEFLQRVKELGVEVYECPIRWPKRTIVPSYRFNRWLRNHLEFTFPYRLSRLLADIDADLVHSHLTVSMKWQALAVLRHARLPWIWTIRGLYKSRGEDTSHWNKTLSLIASSDGARVTGVSFAALKEIDGFARVPESKTAVIYNGIELSKFSQVSVERLNRRHQWKIPGQALVFGSAGRLISVKRFDMAIDAFADVTLSFPEVHFVLAGDGPLEQELKNRAEAQGLGTQFHFVGYQSDINAFLNVIDVFVLSSESEGLPNVLLEAMAVDRPCISTAVGGVPEILDGAGLIVSPNSPKDLATAMRSMMDPALRSHYSSRCRDIVARFDMPYVAAQYRALYQQLIQ